MRGAIPPLPNTPSWRGSQLKHRDKFTCTTFTYMKVDKMTAVVGLIALPICVFRTLLRKKSRFMEDV